jgi:hypothetical protein
LSRINSYLVDENAKLKHNGNNGHSHIINKEKSMDNILESLNDSVAKHRDNITSAKKLEVSMRKND